ncbi:MAG: DUF5681 domain-containing protein [Methyloceanibacter sp.]|jgi:hypothetical protein
MGRLHVVGALPAWKANHLRMSSLRTGERQNIDRRFQKGEGGNPAGRPRCARNKTTLAIEALIDG